MTTFQTADGRLLPARSTGQSARNGAFGGLPGSFPALWSDGERYPNALTDRLDGHLASYGRIYRSQPVLAGVIDMMATRAATLPFGAFTTTADGSRTAVPRTDSLATLFRRPRQGQSAVHLLNFVFTSLFTHGNALLAKVRGQDPEGPPEMLWPLDWAHISAYGEPGGDIEWWTTTALGPEELAIKASETVHFAWPGDDGSPIGVSPLEKLGVTIRLEDAAQRYQTANFRNGNRPANAVLFKENLNVKQLEFARQRLEAFHGSVDQAGKMLMLAGGADVKPLTMTAVEASLIEQRRLDREEIAIVFGLSGPSLTDSTNSALGNVVERFKAFYRDVLPPWTSLVTETFEAQLLDAEPAWLDRVVRFDFGDKLRGEPRELAEKLKIEVEAGLRTRNEARFELGLPPDGDPNDPENPANILSANTNNQAALSAMATEPASSTPVVVPPVEASTPRT
jgi:HK97 family phage portal protein